MRASDASVAPADRPRARLLCLLRLRLFGYCRGNFEQLFAIHEPAAARARLDRLHARQDIVELRRQRDVAALTRAFDDRRDRIAALADERVVRLEPLLLDRRARGLASGARFGELRGEVVDLIGHRSFALGELVA